MDYDQWVKRRNKNVSPFNLFHCVLIELPLLVNFSSQNDYKCLSQPASFGAVAEYSG
jgi:hypothetical protein